MKEMTKARIAYFSMEIGFDPRVPTYSGGLGVLAGDTLRTATRMNVPMVGVTLLYRKGFFRQHIDKEGNQQEEEMNWDPHEHLEPLQQTVYVSIGGRDVKVTGWMYTLQHKESENAILLLDTCHEENSEYDRTLTDKLYGGDSYYRLAQEIVLGIGGLRMLEAVGCTNIEKYHMNEGHAALLTLELYTRTKGRAPLQQVRRRCVFTTHTPVPAGHDRFSHELVEDLLQGYLTDKRRELIYHEEGLNMTQLALRCSRFVNGVAKKHGEVSRHMFPGYHIESITNGVDTAFWTCEPMQRIFDTYVPGWRTDPFSLRYVLSIPDEEIWNAHQEAKEELISFVNRHYNADMDADTFTLGFARRAATYKRGDLLFSDLERLKNIAEECGGLQILYAGKAHPNDGEGKELIRHIVQKMHDIEGNIKVCYIEDYDIDTAQKLIPGVDLWLNTPQRPREASGTSGMKAAHNGVLHFSTLDGWWLEGHIEQVTGFSIGAHPRDAPEQDREEESNDLYSKLGYVILPLFYNERGKWINMMRHAIAINASFFNTNRMLQQYIANAYFPERS